MLNILQKHRSHNFPPATARMHTRLQCMHTRLRCDGSSGDSEGDDWGKHGGVKEIGSRGLGGFLAPLRRCGGP
eukprot:665778-Heterocapsa_arctica.AAC.1